MSPGGWQENGTIVWLGNYTHGDWAETVQGTMTTQSDVVYELLTTNVEPTGAWRHSPITLKAPTEEGYLQSQTASIFIRSSVSACNGSLKLGLQNNDISSLERQGGSRDPHPESSYFSKPALHNSVLIPHSIRGCTGWEELEKGALHLHSLGSHHPCWVQTL